MRDYLVLTSFIKSTKLLIYLFAIPTNHDMVQYQVFINFFNDINDSSCTKKNLRSLFFKIKLSIFVIDFLFTPK